jgi:hypothetical protein
MEMGIAAPSNQWPFLINHHLMEVVAMFIMVNRLTEVGVLKVFASINQFKKTKKSRASPI